MPPYFTTLRNEKERLYDRLAGFIYVLNGALVAYSLVYLKLTSSQKSTAMTCIAAIVVSVVSRFIKKLHGRKGHFALLAFFISIIYWAYLRIWWVSLLMIVLVMLYFISKRTLKVIVSADELIYPAWPERKIKWEELNNVILKDNLLTIDFKNNRIIQQYIDEKGNMLNEEEFNEFCRQQLKQSALS